MEQITMQYTIHHNNGDASRYADTPEQAVRMLKDAYGPDIVLSDSWDTYGADGDERQLVWGTQAIADTDEIGAKAVAEIIRSSR